MAHRSWFLLADIGGTNARFALSDVDSGELLECRDLSVADHPTFSSALQTYIEHVAESGQWQPTPVDGCLAVASPTDREVITFTNSGWVFERRELQQSLGLPSLAVINDFEAIGYACAGLTDNDWEQLGGGEARRDKPIGVLGPGTGLGVCSVVPSIGNGGVTVVPGEGGHVDFAPISAEEVEIFHLLHERYTRISVERLLSGKGLQNIHWALSRIRGHEGQHLSPAEISAAGLAGEDPVAVETLAVFCRVLGSVAGNLGLTLGAFGGIYIAGGIVPRILDFVRESDFRERFLAKGRFRDYLDVIPTRIVTHKNPGLYGALKFLQNR